MLSNGESFFRVKIFLSSGVCGLWKVTYVGVVAYEYVGLLLCEGIMLSWVIAVCDLGVCEFNFVLNLSTWKIFLLFS